MNQSRQFPVMRGHGQQTIAKDLMKESAYKVNISIGILPVVTSVLYP
ncbi:MAG: hypothetical protein ACYS91_20725 [Planctomycetota bacterium]